MKVQKILPPKRNEKPLKLPQLFSLTEVGVEENRPSQQQNDDASEVSEYDIEPLNFVQKRHASNPVKSRYFGTAAREKFFNRQQFLLRQNQISHYSSQQSISELYFDNEESDEIDYPFVDSSFAMSNEQDSEEGSITSSISGQRSTASSMSKYAHEFPDPTSVHSMKINSPRSKFISMCLHEKMNPRASLILRKKLGKSIELQHLCIGNKVATLLSQCLGDMPFIEAVNLDSNSLSDKAMCSLLCSLQSQSTLTALNLSRNKFSDSSCTALVDILKSTTCCLKSLSLQKSGLDDTKGSLLVNCMQKNHTITELDLSDNKIGQIENRRRFMPSMTTCGDAIGALLSDQKNLLTSLSLAWNNISKQSAVTLASSLALNSRLTHLDLSFNSLGDDGGLCLGDSLLENKVLKSLNISNNNIKAAACFTISVGMIENLALRKVVLDNNPIGEAGAQSLSMVGLLAGTRVAISANQCNLYARNSFSFSHAAPLGEHQMDLTLPYERAVAFALLSLAANHSTYTIPKISYKNVVGQEESFTLSQIVVKNSTKYLTNQQKAVLTSLERLRDSSSSRAHGEKLFEHVDIDNSGRIDRSELRTLLDSIGLDADESLVNDILAQYDTDGSEEIDLPQFLAFLKSQYKDACSRIGELTESLAMEKSGTVGKYVPPREGVLSIQLIDSFHTKRLYCKLTSLNKLFGDVNESHVIVADRTMKFRLSEGIALFKSMYAEGGKLAHTLAHVVVRMETPVDARRLIARILGKNTAALALLKDLLGHAYKTAIGEYNGYHVLELSKDTDRICLHLLYEHSQLSNGVRKDNYVTIGSNIGDTSQSPKNPWNSFRNAIFNGKTVDVNLPFMQELPVAGHLSFDYSSIERPSNPDDVVVIHDRRCIRMLSKVLLVSVFKGWKRRAWQSFADWHQSLTRALAGDGNVITETSKKHAEDIARHADSFYTNLPDRLHLYEQGADKEILAVDRKVEAGVKGQHSTKKKERPGKSSGLRDSLSSRLKAQRASISSSHQLAKEMLAVAAVAAASAMYGDTDTKGQTDVTKHKRILAAPENTNESKSVRVNSKIEESFGCSWLLCRHLALIIEAFPFGSCQRAPGFGSYHADLVIRLIPRVADLYNIELVLNLLSPQDIAAVYCRVGWLNLFNPMKPEGYWELNLARHEERLLAKIQVTLAVTEQGQTWDDVTYQENRVAAAVEYVLSEKSVVDASFPAAGLLRFNYNSGSSRGCKPNVPLRKALLSLVMVNEVDMACFEQIPWSQHLLTMPVDDIMFAEDDSEEEDVAIQLHLSSPSPSGSRGSAISVSRKFEFKESSDSDKDSSDDDDDGTGAVGRARGASASSAAPPVYFKLPYNDGTTRDVTAASTAAGSVAGSRLSTPYAGSGSSSSAGSRLGSISAGVTSVRNDSNSSTNSSAPVPLRACITSLNIIEANAALWNNFLVPS